MAKRGREEELKRSCIAFDIDGVFKYGREWSKDGSKALEKVTRAGMPFVFVTNGGGGLTEGAYASSMTTKIAAASKTATALADGAYERGCFNQKGGCTDSTSTSYIEAVSVAV